MKRNPEATCGSEKFPCPYYSGNRDSRIADCRKHARYIEVQGDMTTDTYAFPSVRAEHWCGEHPDFFLEEPEEKPVMPFEIDDATKAHIEHLNREHDSFQRRLRRGFPGEGATHITHCKSCRKRIEVQGHYVSDVYSICDDCI